MMYNYHQFSAFVVVVVHGPDDITRTTWPEPSEAKQHVKKLLERGVLASNIRVYRTRLVRPPLPPF